MLKPKIVLLDSNKLTESWGVKLRECLEPFGNLTSYIKTDPHEVIERALDAEIIVLDKCVIDASHLSKLNNTKYIIEVATGYDNVDVLNAKKYGIKVSNIPNYSTKSVVQHTIALLLEMTNQVGYVSKSVKHENKWRDSSHSNLELSGLTLGLIGFGNISQGVASVALALGMNVIVYSRQSSYSTNLAIEFVDKDTLFSKSDFISLHCTLNDSTRNIINQKTLSQMKPSACLINVGRGGLVNEMDLYHALSINQIAAAAVDVLNIEPVTSDNPLLKLDNFIITSHNAFISEAACKRWLNIIADNLHGHISGNYINLI